MKLEEETLGSVNSWKTFQSIQTQQKGLLGTEAKKPWISCEMLENTLLVQRFAR